MNAVLSAAPLIASMKVTATAQPVIKGEKNMVPPSSEAQRKAMRAAAAGKSNIGIPKKVGKEYAASDKGGKLPKRARKK